VDAVVIGAGPNGLVAANVLADAGWSVLVLEQQPEPGGAVRSGEVTAPGFVSDLYSSFYPLAAASPALATLGLEDHGLRWRHAPAVLAHPMPDGRAVLLSRDLAGTAASVETFGTGDGPAWERLAAEWQRLSPTLLPALLRPFPPVGAAARLLRVLGPAGALRFARFAVLPMRRFGAEEFTGEGATLLMAGNVLHTDLSPESAGSAIYGWLLAMLGQQVGFPTPEGGAGRLTGALVARLAAKGGRLECDAAVTGVAVRDGRAVGVRVGGRTVGARRAVLADVAAPALYLDLVGADLLPDRLLDGLDRFQWDTSTVKIDWALSGPIGWQQEGVGGAGTVHVGGGLDELTVFSHLLTLRQTPADPFLVVGQTSTADPTRSPAGTESAWGYTHVPLHPRGDAAGELRGDWSDPDDRARFVDRVERKLEAYAPGFRDLVLARHVQFPGDLEAADANLIGGAVGGGTAAPHQQLFLRPTPGIGRPETPVERLYLASASAHPGGGVHGAPGFNAAQAALRAGGSGRLALAATRALARRPAGPGPVTGGPVTRGPAPAVRAGGPTPAVRAGGPAPAVRAGGGSGAPAVTGRGPRARLLRPR
jgi:phytoene dehydrogenase-like protein